MATKKVSGSAVAADIRSGMECAALTEKYDLSVAELKRVIEKILARSVLSESELPPWITQEKPWKCPKCGRSQSERSDRCPVCGVIIAKLQAIGPDSVPAQQSGPSDAATPQFSTWQTDTPKSRLPITAVAVALGAICLVALVVVFKSFNITSTQPTQPTARQTENSTERTAAAEDDSSGQVLAAGSTERTPAEEAIIRNRKCQRIQRLAQAYHKTHTYSRDDKFACVDMSIDLWNQIQTAGIRAGLMVGNVQTDIAGFRAENFVKYVAAMNHAWVVAEIDLGRWLPVEATSGSIVSPLDPNYSRYFSGEFFTSPRDLKGFDDVRQSLFRDCKEAYEMQKSFHEFVKVPPRSRDAVLEAYRARGQLETRAQDCKFHVSRIQQVLHNTSEMIVPWVTQWDQDAVTLAETGEPSRDRSRVQRPVKSQDRGTNLGVGR